jgi:hypothetical protein
MWVVAPTVRLHFDSQHRMSVQPWSPTPLTAAEEEKSVRLAAMAEPWLEDSEGKVKAAAGSAAQLKHFVDRDPYAHICEVRFQIEKKQSDTLNGPTTRPILVVASRDGDWHGLSLADTMDPIKWDGKKTWRQYRVPGSDWILTADVNKDVLNSVQDAIDESFNAFLHSDK